MTGHPLTGAGYLFRGFKLITRPGVKRYVLIPLIINSLLFALLIGYGANQFNHFIDWLLPTWLDWLRWLLWPLFALGTLLVIFYTFALLANLVGAPFNGLLAAAVERHLTGYSSKQTGEPGHLIQAIMPSLLSEIKKILYFLIRAVPLLVVFLIPGINLAAPFLWMIFSAWMLALEYMDYPMGNQGLLFSEQRLRLAEKRLTVLGFGGAALLITLIPIVNFLAMPSAVAGATALWAEEFSKHREEH